ncbi:MAG: hypothetical protein IJU34_02495 [Bacteroidales bacterium]|nr:hypothetical protein [Bacteroidales bacterium]
MACNPDFIQYIIDQCSDAGEIAVKKIMVFGLICDNNFYVKVTEPGRADQYHLIAPDMPSFMVS